MIMFNLYDIIYNTFTSLEYWKMNPHPELVNGKNLCLAEPGRQYLIYTQEPEVKLTLQTGKYDISLISPRTGENVRLGQFEGSEWTYPSRFLPDPKAKADGKKVSFAPLGEKWAIKFVKL